MRFVSVIDDLVVCTLLYVINATTSVYGGIVRICQL